MKDRLEAIKAAALAKINEADVLTSLKALDHAFEAKMGSHYGIYERQGEKRFPVKELFGPATPQMMYSNENVMDSIEEKMASTYEERIEHEITRILNGWGV